MKDINFSYLINLTDSELKKIIDDNVRQLSAIDRQKFVIASMGTAIEQREYDAKSQAVVSSCHQHIEIAERELSGRQEARKVSNQRIEKQAKEQGLSVVYEQGVAYLNYSPTVMQPGEKVISQVIPTVESATPKLVFEQVGKTLQTLNKYVIYFTKDSFTYRLGAGTVEITVNTVEMEPIEVTQYGYTSVAYKPVNRVEVVGNYSYDKLSQEHLINIFNYTRGY